MAEDTTENTNCMHGIKDKGQNSEQEDEILHNYKRSKSVQHASAFLIQVIARAVSAL
jgi:hypothetical protein